MQFQSDLFGKFEIIKDKNSSKFFAGVFNDVQHVALIPSEELCDLITLRLIEKKEKPSKTRITGIIDELKALAIQVEDKEDVNTRYTMRND